MEFADEAMEAQVTRQPVGLRFNPTEQELIIILQYKAQGADISKCTNNAVLEKNLYGPGSEPWKLFGDIPDEHWKDYDASGTKKSLYVVTKLKKMSAKKIARTAGCGTWDGQAKPKPFKDYNDDQIVGSMKLLNYLVDSGCESAAAGKGYWYLHEYTLSEESLKEIGIVKTDYVICRVIRDDSKSCAVNVSKKKRKRDEAAEITQEDDLRDLARFVDPGFLELPEANDPGLDNPCFGPGNNVVPEAPQGGIDQQQQPQQQEDELGDLARFVDPGFLELLEANDPGLDPCFGVNVSEAMPGENVVPEAAQGDQIVNGSVDQQQQPQQQEEELGDLARFVDMGFLELLEADPELDQLIFGHGIGAS